MTSPKYILSMYLIQIGKQFSFTFPEILESVGGGGWDIGIRIHIYIYKPCCLPTLILCIYFLNYNRRKTISLMFLRYRRTYIYRTNL